MSAAGRILIVAVLFCRCTAALPAGGELHNDRYRLSAADDGTVTVQVPAMSPQRLAPEFTVLWSETDPRLRRNPSHPDYTNAPRVAVRWGGRSRPFAAGTRIDLKPQRTVAEDGRLRWEYPPNPAFAFAAELALRDGDPELTFTLTPRREAFYSVAFTGAPDAPLAGTLPVPQECDARGHRQFNFVMSEADLHLPRAHVATAAGNIALVADPRECRFRLPTIADSRFGFMLDSEDGRLKPVLFAPLLGGAESRMKAGEPWTFTFRCVVRPGDWKDTYTHVARDIQGFRDQRDNSGPGPLNGCLERAMDFLADRNGRNFAMWDAQQKYYDYFTDKTGVFKPFSPLYGLSAAIVTDDEDFFRRRARPAVEFALSRRNTVFAPYDNADNKQARSATRELGAPYVGAAQLASLDELFQHRTPLIQALAQAATPAKSGSEEQRFFDAVDRASASRAPPDVRAAIEAAYRIAATLNLYPAPPDATVTMERGGLVPVHPHSIGRHRNIWGFPPPQPLRAPEQTVPAWRIARLGVPGIAYPMEYWMNVHGALMRTAGLAHDDFLRDLARWGMVGRFGNYPGDNRSQDSLVAERPDAVERMPWDWNFATVNPGHAWDFAGAVLDFLVSDAFERSRGAIDFPAASAAGSHFRVRIYGGRPGAFYGDENVRLWLPRGLVASDNRQLDWLAGHGNGNVYLALWNQSFREEQAVVALDSRLVQCDAARDARAWRANASAAPVRVENNRLNVTVPPKGIVAFAIPAAVHPRLQAGLYDTHSPPLPTASYADTTAPFGRVHAALLRAGRGLTSAFVYTDALPENVIAARLLWRQGDGAWQRLTDKVYPYEFSPELRDDAGDFFCVFEIEDAKQQVIRSPVIALAAGNAVPAAPSPPASSGLIVEPPPVMPEPGGGVPAATGDDFIAYLERGANGSSFGLRSDGRFHPYSTPQGRRIAFRQLVWDNDLFARGCTRAEAEDRLRAELRGAAVALEKALAARQPPVDFARLDQRQRETLLDFAWTEGIAGLRPEFVEAVLVSDWTRLVDDHLCIRYAGHAPDHARNLAFAARWAAAGRQ